MIIKIEITPDSLAPQVVSAYARAFGWRSEQQDGNVNAYAGQKLVESLKDTVRREHAEEAAETARAEALAAVDAAITIRIV